MKSCFLRKALICSVLPLLTLAISQAQAEPAHAVAMHGAPALAADFTNFGYVNPNAPKGGRLVMGVLATYDSLNPYIPRGKAAPGFRPAGQELGYVYQPLMIRSLDEPFAFYGAVAEKADLPEDRSSITFHLNPKATFSDGKPVTADDILFSWSLLKEKSWPNTRNFYSKVEKAEKLDDHTVKFSFPNANDRELPLILASIPALPKHAIDPEKFDQATLEKPIASGPYIVAEADVGNSVLLKKNPNWWAKDLPSTRGLFNVDEIKYEFYRDANSLFEAFKKGLVDVMVEDDPVRWGAGYDFPAAREGLVKKEVFKSGLPRPTNALVFNTRRPIFADKRVRQAMIALFDFEWMNINLFNGAYERTQSFFHGSELASTGRAASATEREFLKAYPDAVLPDILDGRYTFPKSDGSGHDRTLLRQALAQFKEAGWEPKDGKLTNAAGEKFAFEVIAWSKEQERLLLAFKTVLDMVGVDMAVRQVDSAQAERRRQNFDYDMVPWVYTASLSPGNEQVARWGTSTADKVGSLNLAGVKSPALDAAFVQLIEAKTREQLVDAARTADRILLSGAYIIPLYNMPEQRYAHWSRIRMTPKASLHGQIVESWWYEAAK